MCKINMDWLDNQTFTFGYSPVDNDTVVICEVCVEMAKYRCRDFGMKKKIDGSLCEDPDHEGARFTLIDALGSLSPTDC